MTRSFYEFFCGGGMARAGFGLEWTCTFANDMDAKKPTQLCSQLGPPRSCG